MYLFQRKRARLVTSQARCVNTLPSKIMRLLLVAACTAAVFHGSCSTPYTYPTYSSAVAQLLALNVSYPQFVDVWSAQQTFGLPSAGTCGTDAAGNTVPCEQWFIRITDELTLQPARPQVFFNGNLHGDEQVGRILPLWLALTQSPASCPVVGSRALPP